MNISVIIPVYNVALYIGQCITSLTKQTFTEGVECIIVNDCSSDNSIEIVRDVISTYKGNIQFNIITHDRNKGIAAVRNTGLDIAKGEYIMFLDGDDWCEPNTLETMYRKAVESNADIVVADYFVKYPKMQYYMKLTVPPTEDIIPNIIACCSPQTVGRPLWNKLVRQSLYTSHHIRCVEGIDYNEDLVIQLSLFFHTNRIVKVDKAFVHYRRENASSYTMSPFSKKGLEDRMRCNEFVEHFLADHHLEHCILGLCIKKLQTKRYALSCPDREERRQYVRLYPELYSHCWSLTVGLSLSKRIPLWLAGKGHVKMLNLLRWVYRNILKK